MAKGTLSPRLFSEQGLSSSPRPASFSSGRAAGAADPPDPPPSAQPWGRGCCWRPGARCPSPGGGIAGTPRHGCGGSGQWGGAGLRAHRCASQNRWWALSPRGRHAALGGPAAVRICLIFSWFPIKQPNIKHIRQRQGGTGPGLSSLQEKENGGREGAERGAPCRQHEGLHAHCAPSRPLLWGCCSVGSWSTRCSVGLPLRGLLVHPLQCGAAAPSALLGSFGIWRTRRRRRAAGLELEPGAHHPTARRGTAQHSPCVATAEGPRCSSLPARLGGLGGGSGTVGCCL